MFLFKLILAALLAVILVMVEHKAYDQGFEDAKKIVLQTNPPSDELEMVCVGLWIGEQNKKFYNQEMQK